LSLAAGARLGPYEVVSLLGTGGMGEVYRASDTKLGRHVAIKVLPEGVASDPDRLARFHREAHVLASLNHPNIAAIYGFEDSTGVHALVMELVDGPTLAERIAQGPIPVGEALAAATQIAAALDYAHERGIVHRDLKPANIKVTPERAVKVLDFGLARVIAVDGAVHETQAPTMTIGSTREGTVLGTPAYMSPEQARGQAIDKRTDIWAFGCVLFEMLAGRAPFARQTATEALAAVIERDPDWQALPASTPAAIVTLLERCLTKPLERRLRDIGDVRHYLDDARGSAPVPRRRRRRITVVAAVVLGAAALAVAVASLTRMARRIAAPPAEVTRLLIPLGSSDVFNIEGQPPFAVSPDGHRVVFAINQRLYTRQLDRLDAQPIAGTEPPSSLGPGRGPNWARSPFFSPDGQWVGFFEGAVLMKVPVTGGVAQTVSSQAPATSPSKWLADGTILFGTNGPEGAGAGGIWRVAASGGAPERIVPLKSGEWPLSPQLLPGGSEVLFTLSRADRTDDADVVIQSLSTGERHIVWHGGHSARYLETGHLLFGHDRTLFAVRFDRARYRTIGAPVPVVSDIAQEIAAGAWGGLEYDVADDGTLVYLPDSAVRLRRVLEWVDRGGSGQPLDIEPRAYEYPRISPDGKRVLLDLRDQQNDAWVWDFDHRALTRVTFDRHSGGPVVWTADGARAIYAPNRDGVINLFWKPISGGDEERLLTSTNTQFANAVTPDGRSLLFEEVDPKTKFDLRLLALDHSRESTPLIASPFNDQNPALSTDGAWLAYQSDESGRAEIYVRPFPNVEAGRWQVSIAGGTRPLWSRDGRELFFLDLERRLTVVDVQVKPAFRVGPARTLFDTKPFGLEGINRNFDISPDGRRFLFVQNLPIPPDAKRFVVVQHWLEELVRLVPAATS